MTLSDQDENDDNRRRPRRLTYTSVQPAKDLLGTVPVTCTVPWRSIIVDLTGVLIFVFLFLLPFFVSSRHPQEGGAGEGCEEGRRRTWKPTAEMSNEPLFSETCGDSVGMLRSESPRARRHVVTVCGPVQVINAQQ